MKKINPKISLSILIFSATALFPCINLAEKNQLIKTKSPIVLKSDHSKINGKTGVFEHCGHAILVQGNLTLTADCLVGKKSKGGAYDFIIAKGNPATLIQKKPVNQEVLFVQGNSIKYSIQSEQFHINGKANLKLSNNKSSKKSNSQQHNKAKLNQLEILADKINLINHHQLNNHNIVSREVFAFGKPLYIELIKSGKTDLKATSNKLIFNTQTSNLKLFENVIANLKLGQISAGVFEYNSKTQISSFEKSPNQQVEIIQTKKSPK